MGLGVNVCPHEPNGCRNVYYSQTCSGCKLYATATEDRPLARTSKGVLLGEM